MEEEESKKETKEDENEEKETVEENVQEGFVAPPNFKEKRKKTKKINLHF